MKPGWGWPVGITAILAATVIANLLVMRVATSDPSFAIEPEYYRKAVDFDSTLAHENASARLKWTATAMISPMRANQLSQVTVTVRDSLNQPVEGAVVSITALYVARANDVLMAALPEIAPGTYRAPLAATHVGQWEVRISVARGTEHFVGSVRTEVTLTTPTPLARRTDSLVP